MILKKKAALSFLMFVSSVFFSAFVSDVSAASLSLSPSVGTYNIGDEFDVAISVSSSDQSMNAASGRVSFPNDKLEIVSISKSDSIFSFWVQEPSFSNFSGSLSFEGIVLNPGFIGVDGEILSFKLRAKSTGSSTVSLTTGTVLANDGKGTNILSNLGSANFNIKEKNIIAITPAVSTTSATQTITASSNDIKTLKTPSVVQKVQNTNISSSSVSNTSSVETSRSAAYPLKNTSSSTFTTGEASEINKIDIRLIWILILLFAVLILVFIGQRYYLSIFKIRIRKEVRDVGSILEANINTLKADINEQEKIIKKNKGLEQDYKVEQEIKIINRDLDMAEKNIKKEIREINEEIK